jgi:hypothetical protein
MIPATLVKRNNTKLKKRMNERGNVETCVTVNSLLRQDDKHVFPLCSANGKNVKKEMSLLVPTKRLIDLEWILTAPLLCRCKP